MQIDRVRHDGRANNADGEQQRSGIGEVRRHGVIGRRAPVDRRDERLGEVTNADQADDRPDDERPDPR